MCGMPVISLSASVDMLLQPFDSCSKNAHWFHVNFLLIFVSLPQQFPTIYTIFFSMLVLYQIFIMLLLILQDFPLNLNVL